MYTFWNAKRKRYRNDESDDDDDSCDDKPIRVGENSVLFHCDVTRRSVSTLIQLLSEISCENRLKKRSAVVTIYIHSLGGDVFAGLSAMEHLRRFNGTVHTIVDGFVASAATLILLGGSQRSVVPHSQVLIHQLSTSFWGKYADLRDEFANTTRLMEDLTEVYVSRTCMERTLVETYLKTEVHIDTMESVRLGIAHEILKPTETRAGRRRHTRTQ